jgi:hypothetical protein
MTHDRLEAALAKLVPATLAAHLVGQFLQIRRDFSTKTLERASPGKFVESFVQCLQHIARGTFDSTPKVDHFLDKQVENEPNLPDGLRICGARIARSIYALRNKRNIAHKNEVDPNSFDLAYAHHASSWIMAELIRHASGVSMQEAGALIAMVQVPVGDLVEEIDGVRLVHADVSVKVELLILLHSHYPDRVSYDAIKASLKRRNSGTLRNKCKELVDEKKAVGSDAEGYWLTQVGHRAASEHIRELDEASLAA